MGWYLRFGVFSVIWIYCNVRGDVFGFVCWFEMDDGCKSFCFLCFFDFGKKFVWCWEIWFMLCLIYGLDWLNDCFDVFVVIVEGEKVVDVV